jgi:hypothetical protein
MICQKTMDQRKCEFFGDILISIRMTPAGVAGQIIGRHFSSKTRGASTPCFFRCAAFSRSA